MNPISRLVGRPAGRLTSLLAILFALAGPTAVNAAPRTGVSGVLAGETTITWRGSSGMVLRVPKDVALPKSAMKLYVRGGTYAFVRMFGHRSEFPSCVPLCAVRHLTYLRAMADLPIYGDSLVGKPSVPGEDHFTTYINEPPVVERMNRLEVYLFTDGEATLKLRPTGLTGRTSYRAGGRTRGVALKLPATCLTTAGGACDASGDGYRGFVTFGGARRDIGPAGGSADVIAFQRNAPERDPSNETNQANGVRVCLQPGPMQPGSSPDPATYPIGCNPTRDTADANGTIQSIFDEVNSHPDASVATWNFQKFDNAFDSQYIGWRALHAGSANGVRAAYGVWIPAGIS